MAREEGDEKDGNCFCGINFDDIGWSADWFCFDVISFTYLILDGVAFSLMTQKFAYGVNNFTLLAILLFWRGIL